MIYYSNLHVDFVPLDCGWLCVSMSVQNTKRGAQFMSAYCRYVVYHNAVIVYLAGVQGKATNIGAEGAVEVVRHFAVVAFHRQVWCLLGGIHRHQLSSQWRWWRTHPMMSPMRLDTVHAIGRALVIHPSDGKALTMVGDGAFA